MNNWKTTLCGLLVLFGSALVQYFPEIERYGHFLVTVATGAGLLFCRDFNVSSAQLEQAKRLKRNKRQLPLPLLLLALLCFISGCARFSTVQTDVTYANGKPTRAITTKAHSSTFFESKSNLSNWKANQTDKAQGAEVGALSQESEATSTIRELRELIQSVK